jgi:hypothetical protein
MLRLLARSLVVVAFLAAMFVPMTSTADAAKPRLQACLGYDFSTFAKANRGVGQVITTHREPDGTLTLEGGIGTAIQAWLRGEVPDSNAPIPDLGDSGIDNTCNDGNFPYDGAS